MESILKHKRSCKWMIINLLVFMILSFIIISKHSLTLDEVHAWNIAQYCNITEIFRITHTEGHLCLWYLVIMPFAKLNILFPYSMQILNCIFCMISLVILWVFSPFSNVMKSIITFQFYFLHYLMIYARCYSIGVMFLFILCALYKQRKEHIVIYSILLILLANTSVMALVGAFILGLLFFRDIYFWNKKGEISYQSYVKSIAVLLFGEFMVLFQLGWIKLPFYESNYHWKALYGYITTGYPIWKILIVGMLIFLWIFSVKFFKKDKSAFLFLIGTSTVLLYIFCNVYGGRVYHYIYFFIYLVSAFWIYLSSYKIETLFQKIYYYIFGILCFILVIYPDYYKLEGFYEHIVEHINTNISKYEGKKIFLYPLNTEANYIVPYFRGKLDFYSPHGLSLKNVEAYENIWNDRSIEIYYIAQLIGKGNVGYIFWNKKEGLDGSKHMSNPRLKLDSVAWPMVIYRIEGF